jgi:hypothetical protein
MRFCSGGNDKDLERAYFFFHWLMGNSSKGYAGACWGYNFDWPNRYFFAPAGTPTVVNTALIGLSLLDASSAFAKADQSSVCGRESISAFDSQAEAIATFSAARSACDFIVRDLHMLCPSPDEACFSYTPIDYRYVHNANLLGAWMLSAMYARTGEPALAAVAKAAARFTVRKQNDDGSWNYGISRLDGWVDNFHTGYVLVALKRVAACLQTDEFNASVEAGYRFWKTRMFANRVIPKFYPSKLYPIDIHSVAQAILTFLEFVDSDPEALALAWQVADWAIENMQDGCGFFVYQLRRRYRIRIPYMRWSQAWMQRALTYLLATSGLALTSAETPERVAFGV